MRAPAEQGMPDLPDDLESEPSRAPSMEVSSALADPESTLELTPEELTGRFGWLRRQSLRILHGHYFDLGIASVIFCNSVCIGLESTNELHRGDDWVYRVLENIFLVIYCVELGLQFLGKGMVALRSNWVRFDVFLVGMGVLTSWIIEPIIFATGGSSDLTDKMAPLMVLRVARLVRLARALRLLVQFKTMWMLVRGLLHSASTIVYTLILIFLMLYIFACLGIELITKNPLTIRGGGADHDEKFEAMVQEFFNDVPVSMLTLMQFVIMDSCGPIFSYMILKDWKLFFYFMPFIFGVSISMMNLVTAVIVEGAIQQGKEDKEVQQQYKLHEIKKLLPALKQIFHELDADGGGTVTLEEFRAAGPVLENKLLKYVAADSLSDLFLMLDVDGTGEVDIDEFCGEIVKVVSNDQPVEFARIMKLLTKQRSEAERTTSQIGWLNEAIAGIPAQEAQASRSVAQHLAQVEAHLAKDAAERKKTLADLGGAISEAATLQAAAECRIENRLASMEATLRRLTARGCQSEGV